jgi:cytochrome c oxidase subunit 3
MSDAMQAVLTRGERLQREEARRLGLWMFLATVTMLFAAFTSAYIVRRSGDDWQRVALPPMLWFSTTALAASSGALEAAWRWGARAAWITASAAMAAAVSLGAGFLLGQAMAWRQLMAAGLFLPATPHSSFLYMLTGVHALHVTAALLVLAWGAVHTWTGTGARDQPRWIAAMRTCRTFWHFLLGVWIYLFALLATL